MPTIQEVPPEPRLEMNFQAVLELLAPNGEIVNAEKKQQDGMSELGKIYQKIEKNLHANRGAVAFIRRLQKMSADKRNDFIRTLEPLLIEFGYTLDVIDPEDLMERDAGENAPAPTPGGNSETSALDSARAKLGGSDAGGEPAIKEVSVQLKKYLTLRRGGESLKDAAETAGIPVEEAELHDQADAAGEYSHIPGPKKPAAPKLGIVPPSGKAH